MKTLLNIVVLFLLLIAINACHGDKGNAVVASHSDTLISIPGINLGILSRYCILESDSAIKPAKLSLAELANKLETFNGKYIETEGIFNYGFEKIAISGNSPGKKYGVSFWLDMSSSKLRISHNFKQVAGKHVRIKGMPDMKKHGHLNGYPAEITKIYFLEVTN